MKLVRRRTSVTAGSELSQGPWEPVPDYSGIIVAAETVEDEDTTITYQHVVLRKDQFDLIAEAVAKRLAETHGHR